MALGMNDYISKPFVPKDLFEKINCLTVKIQKNQFKIKFTVENDFVTIFLILI